MIATRDNITQYIPQRDPIVMVDDLVEASDFHAVTQLHLAADNVFASGGFLAEPGLVENIAQTAAVHVGHQCVQRGVPIPIGYIAAVRNLEIKKVPPLGTTIVTTVRITNKVLDVTVVTGEVTLDGESLCTCEMRIFAKIQS